MVEHDDVSIENIIDVGGIVLRHRGILDGYILEVAHGIEAGESIEPTEVLSLTLNMERLDEVVDGL